jgi:hypothetical protein
MFFGALRAPTIIVCSMYKIINLSFISGVWPIYYMQRGGVNLSFIPWNLIWPVSPILIQHVVGLLTRFFKES